MIDCFVGATEQMSTCLGPLNDGRKAAIKVVRTSDTAQTSERMNEARILVQLDQANIVSYLVKFYILSMHNYKTD